MYQQLHFQAVLLSSAVCVWTSVQKSVGVGRRAGDAVTSRLSTHEVVTSARRDVSRAVQQWTATVGLCGGLSAADADALVTM